MHETNAKDKLTRCSGLFIFLVLLVILIVYLVFVGYIPMSSCQPQPLAVLVSMDSRRQGIVSMASTRAEDTVAHATRQRSMH